MGLGPGTLDAFRVIVCIDNLTPCWHVVNSIPSLLGSGLVKLVVDRLTVKVDGQIRGTVRSVVSRIDLR